MSEVQHPNLTPDDGTTLFYPWPANSNRCVHVENQRVVFSEAATGSHTSFSHGENYSDAGGI